MQKNDLSFRVNRDTLVTTIQVDILVVGQFEMYFSRGAKAPNHFSRFMYGLKPVPFKLTGYQYFGEHYDWGEREGSANGESR